MFDFQGYMFVSLKMFLIGTRRRRWTGSRERNRAGPGFYGGGEASGAGIPIRGAGDTYPGHRGLLPVVRGYLSVARGYLSVARGYLPGVQAYLTRT